MPLLVTSQYTLYGADITPYAGQSTELKFSAVFIPFTDNYQTLDNISFSSDPVPEPAVLELLVVAGAGLLWHLRGRKRRI